jgi:hypothetical protein
MSIETKLIRFNLTINLAYGGGAAVDEAASQPTPLPAEISRMEVIVL